MGSRVISTILKLKDQNFSKGLKQANKDAGEFGRYMQVAQNKAERFGQTASKTFKTIGKGAITAAAGGVAVLSGAVLQTTAEMETAFSQLAAQTSASGQTLGKYKDIVTQTFSKGLGESITEVSNAVGKLSTMFGNLDTSELMKVTEGSFTIAKTFNQEATEVGRAVKALMTNFEDLGASDATDLITVAFQKTGDYANDLLDTFSEYSGYFADVGMSAEQFTSTLIKGAESGAWNIDKVGDAVKEFSILSIDGSKKTAEGFKAIGLDATTMAQKITEGGESANNAFAATVAGLANMDDEVERNQAGVALFGTMWEDVRDDVVLSMLDSTNAVEGYQGATQQALDSLNSGPMARMKNAWRDLVTQLSNNSQGSSVLDSLASGAEQAVPIILDLADKAMNFAQVIANNWGPIKETIIGITTAVVAFKVGMMTMTIISTVTGLIQAYRAALAAGTVAQWAMNVAMSANPIGLVVAGIAALIAVGVLLYRNWDTVKAKAIELWNKINENPFGSLLLKMSPIVVVARTIYNNFDKIKAAFNRFKEAINNFKMPAWVSSIGTTLSNAAGKVKSLFDGSHADGLNTVPFDGYVAQLHKGEMVLPARQAKAVREGGGNINNVDKLLNGKAQTTVKQTTTKQSKSNSFGDINIYAKGVTANEVLNEIVPKLKLTLANM